MGKYLHIFYLYLIRSRSMEHTLTHTQYDVHAAVFRWAISTGWVEAPQSAAPMASTQSSFWTNSAHTPPVREKHTKFSNLWKNFSFVITQSDFWRNVKKQLDIWVQEILSRAPCVCYINQRYKQSLWVWYEWHTEVLTLSTSGLPFF